MAGDAVMEALIQSGNLGKVFPGLDTPGGTPPIQANARQMIGGTPDQAVAATNRATVGYTPDDMNASKMRVANAKLGA